ncbi:MAG TPA: homocysteine S-methyltransferase family protein, partial [Phenylobacterium sp.]|nr:homocysteine S-methyltransferase family protein [Phenylobacterium sp.]
MARYRNDLPQTAGRLFLTDAGLETVLVFLEGMELPQFAAFPLLETEEGRAALTRYYEPFLELARAKGAGFVLGTPTWRANPDWGALLGYDLERLRAVNIASVDFIAGLRDAWETPATPVVLDGVIGPRGDGYKAGRMEAGEAEDYHAFQIAAFAQGGADMVSAV